MTAFYSLYFDVSFDTVLVSFLPVDNFFVGRSSDSFHDVVRSGADGSEFVRVPKIAHGTCSISRRKHHVFLSTNESVAQEALPSPLITAIPVE